MEELFWQMIFQEVVSNSGNDCRAFFGGSVVVLYLAQEKPTVLICILTTVWCGLRTECFDWKKYANTSVCAFISCVYTGASNYSCINIRRSSYVHSTVKNRLNWKNKQTINHLSWHTHLPTQQYSDCAPDLSN